MNNKEISNKLSGIIARLSIIKVKDSNVAASFDSVIYDLRMMKENINDSCTTPDSPDVQQFKAITNKMAETFAAKNHDYGNSFEESLDEFGLIASVVRIGDKMNRIKSLVKKEAQVKDESIKDTLLDLASYSVMTLMWMNKNNNQGNATIH